MSIKDFLQEERFYGAKSSPIKNVDVVLSKKIGSNTLIIARVDDDLYQLLVDETGRDRLAGHVAEVGPGLGKWVSKEPFPSGPFIPLSGEQSNSSFITDDVIVKYFRKLEPGFNPDVELLSRIPDCPNISPVLGYSVFEISGESYTLAMAQKFVRGVDGWKFALTTKDSGFEDDARLLGQAIAQVHRSLANAFGSRLIPVSDVAAGLKNRFTALLNQAPVLADYADQVLAVYSDLSGETAVQRIHGDLHLGQVLRTQDRYVLIDFEGEPARPLAERKQPDSPLRDIAGMLRSFDYAAHFDGVHETWKRRATAALLESYADVSNPQLLDAYVLDKALYEVAYELENRPDWVHLPLAAVQRILSG